MCKRIFRAGFDGSKYVGNILIVLFIVPFVVSLIGSEVSGGISNNTTASLRLTRQKVLIQAVQEPRSLGWKKQTRENNGTDENGYALPDIVVEEFRIRAKIHFQTRPKTCKDLLRDFSSDNKTLSGLPKSQQRRILNCQAESLIKKYEALRKKIFSPVATESSKKKTIFNDTEKNYEQYLRLNGKSVEKLKSWKREKDKKIDGHEILFDDYKIAETQNNEVENPQISSYIKNKLHKRSTKNIEPCHRKSTRNETSFSAALRLKNEEENIGDKTKNEGFESRRRDRRSLKTPNNSTTAPNSSNHEEVQKNSSNSTKTKDPESKNSKKTPQSEIPNDSSSKSHNSTKTKINFGKKSNNTMWDLKMPRVVKNYLSFFKTVFGPLIEDYVAINKNQTMTIREDSKKNNSSNESEEKVAASTTEMSPANSTKISVSNLTEIFSNLGKIDFSNSTEISFPNITEIPFSNLTKIDIRNSMEIRFPKYTEVNRSNLTDFSVPSSTLGVSSKISDEAMVDASVGFSVKGVLKKNRNNDEKNEKFAAAKMKNSNITDSTEFATKDFANSSLSQIHSTISVSKDNEGKLSEMEMSVMKILSNPVENFTKISSVKPEEYREKTTLNFTIIDTNCTEPILLDSSPINSANESTNIAEVISTYPTLKRYSRNDTLDEITSSKSKLPDVGNNDSKNRQATNSLSDSNPSNALKKNHAGSANRGRKRSRYKGKMQHPFVGNSLPRIGKPIFRGKNNTSVTSVASVSPTSSLSTTSSSSPTTASSLSTTLSSLSTTSSSSSTTSSSLSTISSLPTATSGSLESSGTEPSTAPPGSSALGDSPELLSTTITNNVLEGEQTIFSTIKSIFQPESRDYSTPSAIADESRILASTEISIKEIPRSTNSADLSTGNEIKTKSSFSARESKQDEAVAVNKILTKKFTELSTLPYENSVSVDSTSSSTLPTGIRLDGIIANSNMEEMKKIEVTKSPKIILPADWKSENERIIVNNNAIKESSTFSYDELTDSSSIDEIKLSMLNNSAVNKSSSKQGNAKIPESVNILSSVDEVTKSDIRKTFLPHSATKRNLNNFDLESFRTVGKNSLAVLSLPRTARRARHTRPSSEYGEPQEPELDYDIDSFGGTETVTEDTEKIGQDQDPLFHEGLRGASTTKNSAFTIGLPHSAVHGVFFEDNRASEVSESTLAPGIHENRDDRSFPGRSSIGRNVSNESPDDLPNFVEGSELRAFVKSLEKFLFDDSVTGTFDRKRLLLRNEDLDAEPSNSNTETRSAIFKTKKLSTDKKIEKSGRRVKAPRNWSKTKPKPSTKSTTKKSSESSSKGKRIRPKTADAKTRKMKIRKENEKMKKEKLKIAKVVKTQLARKNKRAGEKARNPTESVSANKWKSQR